MLAAHHFTSASHSLRHLSLCETVKALAPFAISIAAPSYYLVLLINLL